MKGSEKQVKWAEDIKAEMIAMMQDAIRIFNENAEEERNGRNRERVIAMAERGAQTIADALPKVEAIESAAWFIDNRRMVAATEKAEMDRAEAEGMVMDEYSISTIRSGIRSAATNIAKRV